MQLTHSPSTRIPSTRASFPSSRHPTPDPPMYPPTPFHRTLSKQPRVTPTLFLRPPHPSRCSADLYDSTKLSILSGPTFIPHRPLPPPPFFPLFADRYIACQPVRRYHTVHPRSTHIPHPWHGVPTARDNNRTDLVVFYRTEGERWPCILFHFFERFQAHRSSTTTHLVLVTRQCDTSTRSLSPRFFPGQTPQFRALSILQ